jgi:hypothetical protein
VYVLSLLCHGPLVDLAHGNCRLYGSNTCFICSKALYMTLFMALMLHGYSLSNQAVS